MNEKRKLTKIIHHLKRNDGLTKKELTTMLKTPYQLEQLMINSDLSLREIKEKVVGSFENWHITYKNAYWKLELNQISTLSKLLKISVDDIQKIIEEDIKIQKK